MCDLSRQDPVPANGRILWFDVKIQGLKENVKNGSLEPERFNRSDSSDRGSITVLKQIQLADKKSVKVVVTAVNSVGKSTEASLVVSQREHGRCPRRL